ncbi:hypothetical protein [Streptomyces muensis]|uniref:Uncharacterized protein n=1 Tax=Streptomyces muensis TaxID=1077944 RepID=A0A9X1PST1_STRM4|nr:hypothetical protein [Streptomyces muensis]MCF1592448.1 hypothetical protein [Streptomyces muensis]
MTTALLERAPGPAPPAPPAETYGHEQALDAMLYAARRMGIAATDRQVATLLTVAERHLLPPAPADDFPHGTMRGYRRHRRRREAACESCREACRLESAARRQRRRTTKPCGTEAAYRRHLYHCEEPCQPCKDAHAADVREYRERAAGPDPHPPQKERTR